MSTPNLNLPASEPRATWRELVQIGVVLFKMRVVSLLVMASVGGAFLGAYGRPSLQSLLILVVTGTMAAAGASALNQYIEREKDKQMTRTSKRPLPSGTIDQIWVPIIGILLILIPVGTTALFNLPLAFFLLVGAFIYVGVYTLWLKPRTMLNIVIGGLAGSAAVMSGGAAVGSWQDPAVITLALIVFLWTPAHFWSLAVLYRDDYQRVDVPMLPAKLSEQASAWWVFAHTLPTAFAAVVLGVVPALGWIYFVPVLLASIYVVGRNITFIREPNKVNARTFFISSNIYLAVILLAICLDTTLTAFLS